LPTFGVSPFSVINSPSAVIRIVIGSRGLLPALR
jgi:hypothetical protein